MTVQTGPDHMTVQIDHGTAYKPRNFAPRTSGLLRRAVGGGKQRSEDFPFKSPSIYSYIVIYVITCYKNTHLILHYNNWVFLKIASATRYCDIANSLCLKCSKSKGSSNTTPPAILTRDTATYASPK